MVEKPIFQFKKQSAVRQRPQVTVDADMAMFAKQKLKE